MTKSPNEGIPRFPVFFFFYIRFQYIRECTTFVTLSGPVKPEAGWPRTCTEGIPICTFGSTRTPRVAWTVNHAGELWDTQAGQGLARQVGHVPCSACTEGIPICTFGSPRTDRVTRAASPGRSMWPGRLGWPRTWTEGIPICMCVNERTARVPAGRSLAANDRRVVRGQEGF